MSGSKTGGSGTREVNTEDQDEPTDNLSTLALAALKQTPSPTATAAEKPATPKVEANPWHDVGIIKGGTSCVVKNFFATNATNEHENTTSADVQAYYNAMKTTPKIELQPGTAYRFRVAAINSVGRGEWSESIAFKTCLPGYPGAPTSIKISKSAEGAHISWEPPPVSAGKIKEYSVCLAIKSAANQSAGPLTQDPVRPQVTFARVYCGTATNCVVSHHSLSFGHVDTTTRAAIIFRIAAKNEKGYGPATQVRWLQDPPVVVNKPVVVRRDKPVVVQSPSVIPKKYRNTN